MIKIEHLRKKFKKLHVLNNLTAEIPAGRVVSLIGPNGSGKTTLIKCILGMVRPDSGSIFFDGKDVRADDNYRSRIGYMPQIGRYPDNMRISQVLDMIKNIRRAGAHNIDNDLYNDFGIAGISGKTMQTLSGGTRQKISATLAFMFNPDVFILDEPTAGLDPVSSEILKTKINKEKRKGKLILITSHILSDLEELTTDIIYLQDGNIRFYDSLIKIREHTGEQRLNKAIARLMQEKAAADPIETITGQINISS